MAVLVALSKITSQQSNQTQQTVYHINAFLNYMATNPMAVIHYYVSDMVLNMYSNMSYLTATGTCSRAGGHFFLGSLPTSRYPIRPNGAILSLSTILKYIAASAAKADLGAFFLNAMETKITCLALKEIGHPQPPTSIHCDTTTSVASSTAASSGNVHMP